MRLQSAIFDMDGTLLDSMPVWEHLCSDLLREQGVDPEPDLDAIVGTMTIRQGAEYCKTRYQLTQSVDELETLTHAKVEDFYRNRVQAKPGVQKFLSLLKMEGVWMYVATNTARYLAEAALRCAGIDQYFRGIITCAEVRQGKRESPEIYLRAMRRLRGNFKDTVVFEDALHAAQTAKAAGFRVAAVYDASAAADQEALKALADYYIPSFEEMFEARTLG